MIFLSLAKAGTLAALPSNNIKIEIFDDIAFVSDKDFRDPFG